jgi:hypothetical protein
MYKSDDPYQRILEDVGNMRELTDEQLRFLSMRPRLDIIQVLIVMSKSMGILLESMSTSNLDDMRPNSQSLVNMVSSKMKEIRTNYTTDRDDTPKLLNSSESKFGFSVSTDESNKTRKRTKLNRLLNNAFYSCKQS